MRSIRQPAVAVRLGLGLPSERRHRELYADARQAEIARVQQNFGSAAPPAGGTAELVLGDRPRGDGYEARQAARRKGFEALAANTFPRMPDTAISTDEIFATAGLDLPPRPTGRRGHRRRDAYVCGGPPRDWASRSAAPRKLPPASRSHDARMEERDALNRHEGRTRAIVEGWAAERRAARAEPRINPADDSEHWTEGQQRRLEEQNAATRRAKAARRKADGWRRDRRALDKLKPASTPAGARARAEDGGGALRALETLQRRLDEFDAQAARLSLGGAGA